ncbi:cytochrome C oxidase subunit III [Cupriavidus sp. HPC(L)]|uniref:cytochrome P460 family protein n=1 Tax=Cupriavidus sp. HPC(L) TaxID=1217418 RepID=UPI0002919D15|nr:cytochrome C oxidase subunit III [Cupriavidus sp. HPC(L)]
MQRLRIAAAIPGLALLACAALGQHALAQPPVHGASETVPRQQPAPQPSTGQQSARPSASPIYGVTIPPGYRKWQLIAPAEEAAPLDELRVVLGNPEAMEAIERSAKRFPDGAVLVKLAYKRKPSPDFEPATIPGQPTTVQVMVKDSRRYASTGGWGFGRFANGVAVDAAQHQTCFACHAARVKDRDYVFTRFAP